MDSDPVRAARMLVLWGRLYTIEKRAKEEQYTDERLLAARQAEALPIFEKIWAAITLVGLSELVKALPATDQPGRYFQF